MTDVSSEDLFRINAIGDRFEAAWRNGEGPRIEDLLDQQQGLFKQILLSHLLGIELELRRRAGENPSREAYLDRFPDSPSIVATVYADDNEDAEGHSPRSAPAFVDQRAGPAVSPGAGTTGMIT